MRVIVNLTIALQAFLLANKIIIALESIYKMVNTITSTVVLAAVMLSQTTGCPNGEVRTLEATLDSGGIQICIQNNWTTLCYGKDKWNYVLSINAACNQTGTCECLIKVDKLCYTTIDSCTGLEYSFSNCSYQNVNCSNRNIQLVGGATPWEGCVEVCVDGRWGTVCGEGWTNEDAGHVCAYLGYPREGAEIKLGYSNISDTTPIRNCIYKTNISTCTTQATDCNHTMDLGVVCKSHDQVVRGIYGQCDAVSSVLGVLVGILTVLLVTLLVTWLVKRNKLKQETETQSTVERTLTNPTYDTNVLGTHSHDDYYSNGPTYETIASSRSHTYSTVTRNTNASNIAPLPKVEEHHYHVLESNGSKSVDREVL